MAKSERAKAFEAKQKQEQRAEKERKKNSTNPSDWGRWRQFVESYKIAAREDKQLNWYLLAGFIVPFLLLLALGIYLGAWLIWAVLGISVGLLVAMLLFAWRARKAMYKRYEGQAGSAEVALQMLPKAWVSTPAIAVTKQLDVVHRSVGPGGLILIGEGDPGRLRPLLASERKKHEQVAFGVAVTIVQMGDREDQVPLDKLSSHLKKLPKSLTPVRITEVNQRLRALDAMRPKMPVPKGPMSTKGARAAMRGR